MPTVGLGISKSQSKSVSLGESTGTLTDDERRRVNQRLGTSIDREIPKSLKASFGLSLEASRLLSLQGTLKSALRSKLQTSLGITKAFGAGAGSSGVSLGGAGGKQGRVSLGSSIGTKENRGVAAGGTGSPLAGVKVSSEFDPTAIPGLTSGVKTKDPVATNIQVSGLRDTRDRLSQIITDALTGIGLTPEKQETVRGEIAPQLERALNESFQSSFGPEPEFPHAMGIRLLDARVFMPRSGEWTALLSIDQLELEAEPPTGPFRFVIEGIEFCASVIPARSGRAQGGRTTVRVAGGAGGLAHDLDPKNYGGGITTARTIVDDILRDSGETLSGEADTDLLGTRVEAWQRVKGRGRFALDRICAKIGATWRVLRDGTVWIGVDEWPEVEPDGTVLDDDWADGSIMLAPDTPSMVPGVVVRGQRIEEVTHRLDPSGLRTMLRSVGARSLMDQALEPVRHEAQYSKRYRCKVESQGADGRVDVLVDDERMRGRGVAKCAVRVGIPGTTVTVPAGARCLVGWDDGDPALPFVDGWESGTAMTKVSVGRDARPVARIGDGGRGFLSPGTPVSGTVSGNPFVGVLTVLTPIMFVIEGGSNALDVGSA